MSAVVLGKLIGNGLLACLGIAMNAFILSSNAWHFWNGARRKPGPFLAGEITVSCVVVANLLMDLTGFLWFVIRIFHLECLIGNAAHMCVNYTIIVTVSYSFWFTNCLCVFYMVNIISVPNAFFIRLKRNISVLTYTLLVITFTFSSVVTFPVVWASQLHQTNISEANGNLSGAACTLYMTNDIPIGAQILNVFLLLYLPAGIMVYACVRIVVYLRHHIEKMERNGSSENTLSSCSSSPALQAQIRIARMITCLVILYLLCDTVLFLIILNRLFHANTDTVNTIAAFAISVFTVGIASILIFGNSNLRKNLMSVCCPASEPTHVHNEQ